MRLQMFNLQEDGKPAYLRTADAIRTAIDKRRIGLSEPLPSTRTLVEQLGVQRHTVATAVEEPAAEGWVIARNRSAYHINPKSPTPSSRAMSIATPLA